MYNSFNAIQAGPHEAHSYGELAAMSLELRPQWILLSRTKIQSRFKHESGGLVTIFHKSDSLKTVVLKMLAIEIEVVLANAGADDILIASTLSVMENTVEDFFK